MAIILIDPGVALELDELGMSAAELARQLQVPTNRITGIINGRHLITATQRCVWAISSEPIMAAVQGSCS